jgi:hypothetical protein
MSRRPVLIVIGIIVAVLGALTATAGGALAGVFGRDGTVTSQPGQIATPGRAIVAKFDDLASGYDLKAIPGNPRITVSATGGTRELFIGVGPAAEVDRYLSGRPYDEVTDLEFDPFRFDRRSHNGIGDLPPPGQQSFWVVRSSSTDPSMLWKATNGSYRIVIMNADASAGVDSRVRLAVTLPHLFGIAIALLVTGAICFVGGIALVVVGARRRHPVPVPQH